MRTPLAVAAVLAAQVVLTTSLIAISACRQGRGSMSAVEEAMNVADSTAVVVMSPADCIACNNSIGDWLAWGTGGTNRETVVLLTEAPSSQEAKLLRATRIHWAGVLSTHTHHGAWPRVYLAVRGDLRDSATGQREMLELMRRMSRRP